MAAQAIPPPAWLDQAKVQTTVDALLAAGELPLICVERARDLLSEREIVKPI